ncbi:unnamed protein product [Moneuplotes crassus]|uniref:Uncharacterized protein n=1 Tax=Euplotes crassus TaxID=5936 RepID=A0AAD1XD30_EUPCR|nr:unnamed protein product [Moneuplotes crassus]
MRKAKSKIRRVRNKESQNTPSLRKSSRQTAGFHSPIASERIYLPEELLKKDPKIMNRAERIKYELYKTKMEHRGHLEKIRIFLGIECSLENLLHPPPDSYEQYIINLHTEAPQRIKTYKKMNLDLESNVEILKESIEEETNRKDIIISKYERAFNNAQAKVKSLELELQNIIKVGKHEIDTNQKEMDQLIRTNTEEGRTSIKDGIKKIFKLKSNALADQKKMRIMDELKSLKQKRTGEEFYEKQQISLEQHENDIEELQKEYQEKLDGKQAEMNEYLKKINQDLADRKETQEKFNEEILALQNVYEQHQKDLKNEPNIKSLSPSRMLSFMESKPKGDRKKNFSLLHKIMEKKRHKDLFGQNQQAKYNGYKKLKAIFGRSSSVKRSTHNLASKMAYNNHLISVNNSSKFDGLMTQRELSKSRFN